MRIAILGSTSEIAQDLIPRLAGHEVFCFARKGMLQYGIFPYNEYDAILNFVGVGNPDRAKELGADIIDITDQYDTMAMNYLRSYPGCKYIFMSSGAARMPPKDAYAVAKLRAELRHQYSYHPVVDLRIYSYFSHTQDVMSSFFMTQVVRAIRDKSVLMTSPDNMTRDYMGAEDFHQIIEKLLDNYPTSSTMVECFTKDSISKFEILDEVKKEFGLNWEIHGKPGSGKSLYVPTEFIASRFGYKPSKSSLENVMDELREIFNDQRIRC